jgi:hypothetical protein
MLYMRNGAPVKRRRFYFQRQKAIGRAAFPPYAAKARIELRFYRGYLTKDPQVAALQ